LNVDERIRATQAKSRAFDPPPRLPPPVPQAHRDWHEASHKVSDSNLNEPNVPPGTHDVRKDDLRVAVPPADGATSHRASGSNLIVPHVPNVPKVDHMPVGQRPKKVTKNNPVEEVAAVVKAAAGNFARMLPGSTP